MKPKHTEMIQTNGFFSTLWHGIEHEATTVIQDVEGIANTVKSDVEQGIVFTAKPDPTTKTSLPTGESINLAFFAKFANLAVMAAYEPITLDPSYTIIYSKTNNENYAFIATSTSKKEIIVAFRGTVVSDFKNIEEDLEIFSVNSKLCTGCSVDYGFGTALNAVHDDILSNFISLYKANPTYLIRVTGHSLGAAMATLFAVELAELNYDLVLVTFGSPRVGNNTFANYVNKLIPNYYRVVMKLDPVPLVPDIGYWHCGQLIYFTSETTWNNYGFIDHVGDVLYPNISDHSEYENIKA